MIGMVSELLEMARLEAGMVDPERSTVDLVQLAEECAAVRRPEAAQHGVEIEIRGAGMALTDPAMLRRVIDNLLDNGLKFAPRASRVEIAVDGACLRVIDEGPGFEQGTGTAMFEKFRQGRPHGVKRSGVGLGLAIVARLVALLDGRVEIEERPPTADRARGERGASVLVELPEPRT
jgi:two-component system CheB/CheR fusion protein